MQHLFGVNRNSSQGAPAECRDHGLPASGWRPWSRLSRTSAAGSVMTTMVSSRLGSWLAPCDGGTPRPLPAGGARSPRPALPCRQRRSSRARDPRGAAAHTRQRFLGNTPSGRKRRRDSNARPVSTPDPHRHTWPGPHGRRPNPASAAGVRKRIDLRDTSVVFSRTGDCPEVVGNRTGASVQFAGAAIRGLYRCSSGWRIRTASDSVGIIRPTNIDKPRFLRVAFDRAMR
jgi:hypothetical protein